MITTGSLMVLYVTIGIVAVFSAAILYHWLMYGPSRKSTVWFLVSFFVVSAVLLITMALIWSFF